MVRSRGHTGAGTGELAMYWDESSDRHNIVIPDKIVDLVFAIRCRSLPVDHAWALWEALEAELPWLAQESGAGVHPIYVAGSQNGWMRPENPDDLLHLSRRTKLSLRVPKARAEEAGALAGKTLQVAGFDMVIQQASERPLSALTTIFSRHVACQGEDEQQFMEMVLNELRERGIRPRKMLPGRGHVIRTPAGNLATRSLMLSGLTVEDSFRLQEQGLGQQQHLGCGLFIPHKGIDEVGVDRTE